MSFRFRRSVKLGKGVRLNVTKKGLGVSFGTKGLRRSYHSSGRRTSTIGIPGTGLSYVKTGKGKRRKSTRNSGTTDIARNEAVVQDYEEHLYMITNIHQQAPERIDWHAIAEMPAPFTEHTKGPNEVAAIKAYEDFKPNFLERIITSMAEKRREKLAAEIESAVEKDQADYSEWAELTNLAANILNGNLSAYEEAISQVDDIQTLSDQGLTTTFPNAQTAEITYEASPADVVPKQTLSLTKTGKVSKRAMGKTKYYGYMKDYVCSSAIWLARLIFAYLPVERVIIHMTERALNKATGYEAEKVLLSVQFDKDILASLQLEKINPSDAMANFHHHMDHLKTKGFRTVERIEG